MEEEKQQHFFFKIMLPGFHQKLTVPSSFCKKLKDEKSEHAVLTSRVGTYKVRACRDPKGLIFLKEGWEDFATQNDISVEDVVVFENTGGLHFNVFVFDRSACEKNLPEEDVVLTLHPRLKHATKATMDLSTFKISGRPHFDIIMKPHNGHKTWATVNIPTKFLRLHDLSQKTSASLRAPCGKTWTVSLYFMQRGHSCVRCLMTRGWYQFYASNKLKDGDVCLFELQHISRRSSVVAFDVQIFRAPL